MKTGRIGIFILLVFLLASCEKDKTAEKQASSVPAYPYKVTGINETGVDSLIHNRHGKILVLNIWATWCVPCRKEFPSLIRLAREYQDKPVEVIGVSADYVDEIGSKVLPFLKEQQANFKVYVQNFADQNQFIDRINTDWAGALPVTVLYDTLGVRRVFLLGEQTYDEFREAVEKVISS